MRHRVIASAISITVTLLQPENKEKLKSILLYHVVQGNVMAADVVNLKTAKTVNGQKARITIKDDKVMINDAKILQTDIKP